MGTARQYRKSPEELAESATSLAVPGDLPIGSRRPPTPGRRSRERRLQIEEELRAREAELSRKLEEEQQRKREEEERRKAEAEAAARAERERLEEMQRKQDE